MKRPSLAFGLVVFTMALLFLFLGSSTLIVLSLIALAVILFYLLTKNEKVKNCLIIPTIAISILISVASLSLNDCFVYEKSLQYENSTMDIVATVIERQENKYILKTSLMNSEEAEIKIFFATEKSVYDIYDTVFIDDASIIKSENDSEISEKIFLRITSYKASDKLGEKGRDFYYYALALKSRCINKLSEYLYYDSFGIASGMLFGGTQNISDELTLAFRSSGVAHLLAVSGLHTSLWCGLFISILKLFKLKEKYANLFGILILVLLTIISGFTPSVIRASFMMGITLIAPIFKKRSDSINSLGLAAGIILVINPYVLYSPSFFLSFLATLGVVLSPKFTYKINPLLSKIKPPRPLKHIIQFVSESLLISVFAALFTLPASVYYFGTVSIIAPITNLLTVNLAFVAMVATLISLTVSFIPFEIFEALAEFLFTLTDYILKLLIAIIKAIGSLKYASISANEGFVYIAVAISVLLLALYIFALNKMTLKSLLRKLAVFLIVLPVIFSLILSVIPFNGNTEFTVLSNTNTPNLIIRCGTHYVIINAPESFEQTSLKSFPKTSNDTIDLFAVTSLNSRNLKSVNYINDSFKINAKMITSFTNSTLYNFDTDAFTTAEVSSDFEYSLKNKINIRIFDTYQKNCAIIEINEKIIVLSFSEYNDLTEIKKELGKIDVLVLPESIPDDFNITVDTLIICSTDDNTIHDNDKAGYFYSDNFCRTSTSGDIKIKLGW